MLLQDIEAHLAATGAITVGSTTYTVRRNFYPDTPDAVVTLIEFAAGSAVRAMGPSGSNPVRDRAGLTVLVRGPQADYDNARSAAETVHQRLDFLFATINGRRYSIQAMHVPQLKEQDRSRRWIIEANYLVFKERG